MKIKKFMRNVSFSDTCPSVSSYVMPNQFIAPASYRPNNCSDAMKIWWYTASKGRISLLAFHLYATHIMASHSLGIDLHKKFAYWTLMNQERQILWQGKVPTENHAAVDALSHLPVVPSTCTPIIEPVEQWGWYAELLESHGLQVKLANPLQVGLIAKSRLKYDKVDSKILTELLQSGFLPTAYLAPREARDLQELLRACILVIRMQTQIKNRLHGILAKHGFRAPVTDLFGKRGQE
jgi:Transposase